MSPHKTESESTPTITTTIQVHPKPDPPQSSKQLQTQSPLPSPPFIIIQGVHNFRDISSSATSGVRSGLIYRSGALSHLTPEGHARLRDLGIKKVFDLRSSVEVERTGIHGDAKPKSEKLKEASKAEEEKQQEGEGDDEKHAATQVWETEYASWTTETEGPERVFVPIFPDDDYSPEAIATRFADYASSGPSGFSRVYLKILLLGSASFRTILLHLSSPSPGPILLHCTAGKDRTGVAVMLLLLLAGLSASEVADEYALTDVGLRDWKPAVVERLMGNPALNGNREGAENMVSAKRESMLDTVQVLERQWGGVEGYVLGHLGLDVSVIERVRQVLRE